METESRSQEQEETESQNRGTLLFWGKVMKTKSKRFVNRIMNDETRKTKIEAKKSNEAEIAVRKHIQKKGKKREWEEKGKSQENERKQMEKDKIEKN